jgi:hypothetical protein
MQENRATSCEENWEQLGAPSILAPVPRSLHAHPQKFTQDSATMVPDDSWIDPSDPADPS